MEGRTRGQEPDSGDLKIATIAVVFFAIVMVIILVIAAAFLIVMFIDDGEARYTEPIPVQDRPADSDTVLDVLTVNGYIRIVGWDQNVINVTAVKRADSEEDLDKLDLKVTQNGNNIVIEVTHTTWNFRSERIDLDLRVPREATIYTLVTTNGQVEVKDMSVVHEVNTTNGAVKIEDVTLVHNVSTTNGAISVEISSIDSFIGISSFNGRIDVHILSTLDATVEITTLNGRIRIHDLSLDLTLDEPKHKIGNLGNGGDKIDIDTLNGNIDLHELT